MLENLLQASEQFLSLFGSATNPTATPDKVAQDPAYQAAVSVFNPIDSDTNAVYVQHDQIAKLVGQPDAMQQVVALLV